MNTKRILALVLTLSMVFSLALPGFASADDFEIIEGEPIAVNNVEPVNELIEEETFASDRSALDEGLDMVLVDGVSDMATFDNDGFTVQYVAHGQVFAEDHITEGFTNLRNPGTPEEEEYTENGFRYVFSGWYIDGVRVEDCQYAVGCDTTVTAQYTQYPAQNWLITVNGEDQFLSKYYPDDYLTTPINDPRYENVTFVRPVESIRGESDSNTTIDIGTYEDLLAFAENVNSGLTYSGHTVRLINNIYIGESWPSIGVMGSISPSTGAPIAGTYKPFAGTFDGGGHVISNLTGNLFNCVEGARIENLTIDNATISGKGFVGAVAGYAYNSTIENVNVTGTLVITGTHLVGGAFGYVAETTINTCSVRINNLSSISADDGNEGTEVGGLVGCLGPQAKIDKSLVSNLYPNLLAIYGAYWVGGLVGVCQASGTITDSSVDGVTIQSNLTDAGESSSRLALGGFVGAFDGACGAVTGGTINNVIVLDGAYTENVRKGIVTGGKSDTTGSTDLPTINVSGTNNMIEVSTADQLKAIAKEVNEEGNNFAGNTVVLGASINLSSETWTPIGRGATASNRLTEGSTPFSGIFDGNGFIIRGLNVNNTSSAAGLFGVLDGATVRNLTLSDARVNGGSFVGTLAGVAGNFRGVSSNITGVAVTNPIVNGSHYVGGVVGYAQGSDVTASVISGSVIATDNNNGDDGDDAGGIIGYMTHSTITDGVVNGVSVTALRQGGGMVGLADDGSTVAGTVDGATIICNDQDPAEGNVNKVAFGGMVGALKKAVTVNASVFNTELRFADNVSETKVGLTRMGMITGGTYNADRFAITESTQTGTAIVENVALPSRAIGPASEDDHVLIGFPRVTLTLVNGETSTTQMVAKGQTVKLERLKDVACRTFVGWSDNSTTYNDEITVTDNITLTAKWDESTHNIRYDSAPEWRWIRVSDEHGYFMVYATFTCACGTQTATYPAEVVMDADTYADKKVFTASVSHDGYDYEATYEMLNSYTVSMGGRVIGTYLWGNVVTMPASQYNENTVWKINDRIVAEGCAVYKFAVTENSNVKAEYKANAEPKAIVNGLLTAKAGENQAVFNVKWSLPSRAKDVKATIYRGVTSTGNTIVVNTLLTKGTPFDTQMEVQNGDFTFTIKNLELNKYQYAMMKITYTLDGVAQEVMTNVARVHVGYAERSEVEVYENNGNS